MRAVAKLSSFQGRGLKGGSVLIVVPGQGLEGSHELVKAVAQGGLEGVLAGEGSCWWLPGPAGTDLGPGRWSSPTLGGPLSVSRWQEVRIRPWLDWTLSVCLFVRAHRVVFASPGPEVWPYDSVWPKQSMAKTVYGRGREDDEEERSPDSEGRRLLIIRMWLLVFRKGLLVGWRLLVRDEDHCGQNRIQPMRFDTKGFLVDSFIC